jgi:hypothetical protein
MPRVPFVPLVALAACMIREQPPTFGPPRSPPPAAPSAASPYAQAPAPAPSAAPAAPAAPATPATPAAPALHDCDHDYVRHHQPAALTAAGAELHVIGVYGGAEVEGEHGIEPRQAVRVTVDRPGKDVELVLTAHDAIDWTIVATPGTRVRRAILSGYEEQRAIAPAGVQIDAYSAEAGKPFGKAYSARDWPSVDAELLVAAAQQHTQLALTSFRGCHRSPYFTITDEPATAPPPVTAATSLFTRCAKVLAESRRCVAVTRGGGIGTVVLGLDSGTTCQGPAIAGLEPSDIGVMLGWIGDRIYTCIRSRGLAEISLATGAIRVAPVSCEGVTSDGTSLIVMPDHTRFGSPIRRFASFDQLLASPASGEDLPFAGSPRLVTTRGNLAYSARHSTDEISVEVLDSGKQATIKLDRYDDWILGLDTLSDGTLVIGSPRRTLRDVRLFDGATGAQLRSYSHNVPDADIVGLKCREGAL